MLEPKEVVCPYCGKCYVADDACRDIDPYQIQRAIDDYKAKVSTYGDMLTSSLNGLEYDADRSIRIQTDSISPQLKEVVEFISGEVIKTNCIIDEAGLFQAAIAKHDEIQERYNIAVEESLHAEITQHRIEEQKRAALSSAYNESGEESHERYNY